jgi:hypothetical protein
MKKQLVIFLLMYFSAGLMAQDYEKFNPALYSMDNVCLSDEEYKLYKLVMDYRASKGLPSIPLSRSLTFVAQLHVWDLNAYNPDVGKCNMHSWTDNPLWSGCCYTRDHAKAQCMWDKPRELTNYQGNGFEIAYGMIGSQADAQGALAGWQGSAGHNDVMINAGIWTDEWKAIGIALANGYAVIWFGNDEDNTSKPTRCME